MQKDRMDWRPLPVRFDRPYITLDVRKKLEEVTGKALPANVIEEIEFACRSYVAIANSFKKPPTSKKRVRFDSIQKASLKLIRALGNQEPIGILHTLGLKFDVNRLYHDLVYLAYSVNGDILDREVEKQGYVEYADEESCQNSRGGKQLYVNEIIFTSELIHVYYYNIDNDRAFRKPKSEFLREIFSAVGQPSTHDMVRERHRVADSLNYLPYPQKKK